MSESDELGKLGELHQRGVLSDDEFARAKARVLSGSARPAGAAPGMATLNGWRRSPEDRWIAGVCGGLAQVTGIASWILRLFFVLLFLCAGSGVLLYLLLWFFVPLDLPSYRGGQNLPRAS